MRTTYYWKLVARVGSRLFSIFDGRTEYQLNVIMKQRVLPNRQGGFYLHRSKQEALAARVPSSSKLFVAPRVLIKCLAWGDCIEYKNCFAFSHIRPIEVHPCPFGYLSNRFKQRKHTEIVLSQTRKRLPPFYTPIAPWPKEYRRRAETASMQTRQRALVGTVDSLRPRTSLAYNSTRVGEEQVGW